MDKTLEARVLAVLKEVEYSAAIEEDSLGDNIYGNNCCPICGSVHQHRDDCELGALIKELTNDAADC